MVAKKIKSDVNKVKDFLYNLLTKEEADLLGRYITNRKTFKFSEKSDIELSVKIQIQSAIVGYL